MKGTFVALSMVMLAAPASAPAEVWQIEEVGESAIQCSLDVDAQGVPHVGFFSTSPVGGIRYARRDPGPGWVVEIPESGPDLGGDVVLRLDGQGEPRLSYVKSTWGEWALHFAAKSGSVWQPEVVAQRFAIRPSLALGPNGETFIVYVELGDGGTLYTANRRGGQWFNHKLTNNPVGGASVVLDAAVHPQIAYRDLQEQTLKFARFTGTVWQFETVAAWSGDQAFPPSLALDANGLPQIAYHVGTTVKLAAKGLGGSWSVEDVETLGDLMAFKPTLDLDARGNPHIAYGMVFNSQGRISAVVRYARRRPVSIPWSIQTIEEIPGALYDGSFALDGNGVAHVAYIVLDPLRLLRYATNPGPGLPGGGME